MVENISICQVNFLSGKVDIVLKSRHTFLNSKMVCTFLHNNRKLLSFESDCMDLFEGEQAFTISHGLIDLFLGNVSLVIEVFDQDGVRQCCHEKHFKTETENLTESPLKVFGRSLRKTEGGMITIRIGGVAYRIHANYDNVLYQCEDYLTADEPDEEIIITSEDIINEKRELGKLIKNLPKDSEIEVYAVRRRVSEAILDHNEFQIHGAAVAIGCQGYIFTADSGVGKTTHIKLWLENLPNAYVVNGDHPIIQTGKEILVYGSPWSGKEKMNTNTSVHLRAIILMERSESNSIAEISMNEALPELIRQIHKPSDLAKMKRTLQLLSELNGRIKFYKFKSNNFAEDAFPVSYKAIHMDE